MKIAISIPDELHETADAFAKKHGLNRSSLYVQALQEFLESRKAYRMTEQINAVCEATPTFLNKFQKKYKLNKLKQIEW